MATVTRKRQDPRLASARAYYRLAAKADRSGNYRQGAAYRAVAERLVQLAQRAHEDALRRESRRLPWNEGRG